MTRTNQSLEDEGLEEHKISIVHFIAENRIGFYITGLEDSPTFKTVQELLEYANENKIIITRVRGSL